MKQQLILIHPNGITLTLHLPDTYHPESSVRKYLSELKVLFTLHALPALQAIVAGMRFVEADHLLEIGDVYRYCHLLNHDVPFSLRDVSWEDILSKCRLPALLAHGVGLMTEPCYRDDVVTLGLDVRQGRAWAMSKTLSGWAGDHNFSLPVLSSHSIFHINYGRLDEWVRIELEEPEASSGLHPSTPYDTSSPPSDE